MKQRWLVNLALVVVVAALAAVALYQSKRTPVDERPALTRIDPAAVERIEIERTGTPTIRLERRAGAWRLVHPLAARANSFTVETLFSVGTARSEAQLPLNPDALGQYGLARPPVVLRLGSETIAFGGMHPLRPLHYVRYGDTLHLIASRYFAQVSAPYTELIDTQLIEDGRRPVAFQLPGFSLRLTDGSWQRTPEDQSISGDRINDFVEEWRHARALSVERYGGRALLDHVRITFEGDNGKRERLTLGVLARQPELVLYRRDEGLEYHFPEEIGKRLLALGAS